MENKNKTLFQELFGNKKGLSTIIEKHSEGRVKSHTIRKAQKGGKINETSAFEIYASMLELHYFSLEEYTKQELFKLVDNK